MTTLGASPTVQTPASEAGGNAGERRRAALRQLYRALAVELRTSPALLPVAAVTVIGCLQLAAPDAQWAGYWQNATLRVHTYTCIVIGTVCAAVAAWSAGRSRASGLQPMENTGRVSGARIILRAVGPIWIIALAGFMLLLGGAWIRSAMVHLGTPPWGLVVMTAAVLAMQIAVGAALGAWLPRGVAPVVTIVLLYGGGIAPVYVTGAESTWGRLYPIVQQVWDPMMREAAPRLLVASVWLAAASAVLVLVAGRRWIGVRPGRRPFAVAGVAAAAAAALVLVPQVPRGEQFATLRGAGDRVVCTAGPGPSYCAWADHSDLLPAMTQASNVFARATEGLTFVPRTLTEQGVAPVLGRPAVEIPAFTTPVPSQSEALSALVSAAAPLPGPSCIGADGYPMGGSEAAQAVPALLSERVGVPATLGADSAAFAALKQLSTSRQNAWMNAAAKAEFACHEPPAVPTR